MIRPWLLRPGSRWMPNVLISSEVGWGGGSAQTERERESSLYKILQNLLSKFILIAQLQDPILSLAPVYLYMYRRKSYIGAQRSCTVFRSAVTHAVVWALKTNYSQSFFMLNTGHSDAEKRMNIRISTLFRYMNLLGGPC